MKCKRALGAKCFGVFYVSYVPDVPTVLTGSKCPNCALSAKIWRALRSLDALCAKYSGLYILYVPDILVYPTRPACSLCQNFGRELRALRVSNFAVPYMLYVSKILSFFLESERGRNKCFLTFNSVKSS